MSIKDKELHCREIITKAVCGKGRRFTQASHTVTPTHSPSGILGAWIINNQYEAIKSREGVEVVGTYDINIWYSYDRNTKTDVVKETVSYIEEIPLQYMDKKHRPSTAEVTATATQEPNCVEALISSQGDSMVIRVEREFLVEMIAETKVCVPICLEGCNDFDDKDVDFSDLDSDDNYEEMDPDLFDEELS